MIASSKHHKCPDFEFYHRLHCKFPSGHAENWIWKSIRVLNSLPTCDIKYIWICIQTGLRNLSQSDKCNIKSSRTLSYNIENKTNISFIADDLTRNSVSSEIEIDFIRFHNCLQYKNKDDLVKNGFKLNVRHWQLKSCPKVIEIRRSIKKKEHLHSHHDNLKFWAYFWNTEKVYLNWKSFLFFLAKVISFFDRLRIKHFNAKRTNSEMKMKTSNDEIVRSFIWLLINGSEL